MSQEEGPCKNTRSASRKSKSGQEDSFNLEQRTPKNNFTQVKEKGQDQQITKTRPERTPSGQQLRISVGDIRNFFVGLAADTNCGKQVLFSPDNSQDSYNSCNSEVFTRDGRDITESVNMIKAKSLNDLVEGGQAEHGAKENISFEQELDNIIAIWLDERVDSVKDKEKPKQKRRKKRSKVLRKTNNNKEQGATSSENESVGSSITELKGLHQRNPGEGANANMKLKMLYKQDWQNRALDNYSSFEESIIEDSESGTSIDTELDNTEDSEEKESTAEADMKEDNEVSMLMIFNMLKDLKAEMKKTRQVGEKSAKKLIKMEKNVRQKERKWRN